MSSERRIASSRANGAKSRGPITPEGKAKSARNSLKHGLFAKSAIAEGAALGQPGLLAESAALGQPGLLAESAALGQPGLLAESAAPGQRLSRTLVLDSESAHRFDALLAELMAELQPQTGIERAFVESMAVARWRQMRIWVLEKAGFDHEIRKQDPANASEDTPTRAALAFRTLCDQSNSLELMNRYEVRFDRQYSRALRQFFDARQRRAKAHGIM